MSDLPSTFADRLDSVGGTARWCAAADVSDLVLEAASAYPGQPLVYTDAVAALLPDLIPTLRGRGVACVAAHSLEDALSCPLALSTAELAIAETGSVVTTDRALEQRAPSMLSSANLIFVPAGRLVADLDAAGVWLRDSVSSQPYVSFITGPSRSADIERTLTIGVQGPREVTVVFIADDTDDGQEKRANR